MCFWNAPPPPPPMVLWAPGEPHVGPMNLAIGGIMSPKYTQRFAVVILGAPGGFVWFIYSYGYTKNEMSSFWQNLHHCLYPNLSRWQLLGQPVIQISSKWEHFHSRVLNSLWPSDAMWWLRSGSTSIQVMACCPAAPSHYLNQCWLIISKAQWHSYKDNCTKDTSVIKH